MLVARMLPRAGIDALRGAAETREGGLDAPRGRLLELARGAEAIVVDPTVRVDGELLDAAGPQLRVVANYGVGYDHVDVEACDRRGVVVSNTPGVLTDSTAELALALTLAAARGINAAEADLRDGRWAGPRPDGYLGMQLSGACFGIAGMGRIGTRYAELVRPMAGEIVYIGRTPNADADRRLGTVRVDFEDLLRRSDVISLHLPATPETAGLVGPDELQHMKPDAILVNTARGTLVAEQALAAALRGGEIGAAGLDVYQHEPDVPAELRDAPRCVLLPHIGSATVRARNAMARLVADNVLVALRGGAPPNRVGPAKR